MRRLLPITCLLALPPALSQTEAPAAPARPAAVAGQETALVELRALVAEARAAAPGADPAGLPAVLARVGRRALELVAGPADAASAEVLADLARFAIDQGIYDVAEPLQRRVVALRAELLPATHLELAKARGNLGLVLLGKGAVAAARAELEAVVEVLTKTLPAEHADLQWARSNLALALRAGGDLRGARELLEQVLGVLEQTVGETDSDLSQARQSLGGVRFLLGDLPGARALYEQDLRVRSATLPAGDRRLQTARANLAMVLEALGEERAALQIEREVLADFERSLHPDHNDLQTARSNLAATLCALGDWESAAALTRQVLEVYDRTRPAGDAERESARGTLATVFSQAGDLQRARALQEEVVAGLAAHYSADHPGLLAARGNLARILKKQGDLAGARIELEHVLEQASRTMADDSPYLQHAREGLGGILLIEGDVEGARALFAKVLEVRRATLPEDNPDVGLARSNLALALAAGGEVAEVREHLQADLESTTRALGADHVRVQRARQNLAVHLKFVGELEAARALLEQVLEVQLRTLHQDASDPQSVRLNLIWTLLQLVLRGDALPAPSPAQAAESAARRRRCVELGLEVCADHLRSARSALLSGSAREAQERCARQAVLLDTPLSLAGSARARLPAAELDAAAFLVSECTRGVALTSALLRRRGAERPATDGLRSELQAASRELAAAAQRGLDSAGFRAAIARRDGLERQLLEQLAADGTAAALLDPSPERLLAGVPPRTALVGYLRYTRWDFPAAEAGSGASVEVGVPSLCAFVLRRADAADGRGTPWTLTRVELGPLAPIEAAVESWRAALGVFDERGAAVAGRAADGTRAAGLALRRLVFDPLLAASTGCERLVLALDDVLHLVPIDALPLDAADSAASAVGDRWRIETRCTLLELVGRSGPRTGPDTLLTLGGASFESRPLALESDPAVAAEQPAAEQPAAEQPAAAQPAAIALLRGGAWERGFTPLTYTGPEAREIAALHEEVAEGEASARVLEKRQASRAALEQCAPRARWLHIATHGWFAPQSIRSWTDPEPLDRQAGIGARASGAEQVQGMSPLLLCGLALTGANLPDGESGRPEGLITAEELSTFDLSSCELAVLSACDTNVGVRRAGQGVASLQQALQMAGARSVITSLWKVRDEATKDLMLDFYRRLWVHGKPKAQALWEAKTRLREAKDETGKPKYALRDWAAWVLTGEPD